jgi:hypothetical protein
MANLTIAVDDGTLKKARMRALEEDTSVNAVLREYLEEYAGRRQEQLEAARRIIEASRESMSGSGPDGRNWKREDAYEERLGRYPTG